MIARLIAWSVANRFLVLLATAFAIAWGVWSVRETAVTCTPENGAPWKVTTPSAPLTGV